MVFNFNFIIGQICFKSEDGYAFCGYKQQMPPLPWTPQFSETNSCEMSACSSINNPCGNAPCAVINGLIACLHPNSPFMPTTTESPAVTTPSCPIDFCNGNPCYVVNGSMVCYCMSGSGPNCASSTITPTPTATTASYSQPLDNCPINFCNGSPCVIIGGMPQCFCLSGTFGSNCEYTIGTTTGATTTTTTTTDMTTVILNICGNGACNGEPCIVVNGVPRCFCTNGSSDPNCGMTTTTTTTEMGYTSVTNSINPTNCFPNNPCKNSQPCLTINGQPICYCSAQFQPPFCT